MAAPKKDEATTKKAPAKKSTASKAPTKKAPAKKAGAADELAKTDAANGATQTENKAQSKAPVKLTAAAKKKILAVPAAPTDQLAETCAAIESLDAKEAVALGKDMIESKEFNEFKIGGVLALIDINSYWKESGAESFKEFVEKHYNFQYRKATYLMKIYNSMVDSGVEWSQVGHLGWSKLKEICEKLTLSNVDVWVKIAEENTVVNLIEEVKKRDADGNLKTPRPDKDVTDTPQVSTRTFKLHVEQKETVNEAVSKAKSELDTEHDNAAITHVAELYLQGKLGKRSAAPAKAEKATPWQEQIRNLVIEAGDDDEARLSVIQEAGELLAELYPELDINVVMKEDDDEGEEDAE